MRTIYLHRWHTDSLPRRIQASKAGDALIEGDTWFVVCGQWMNNFKRFIEIDTADSFPNNTLSPGMCNNEHLLVSRMSQRISYGGMSFTGGSFNNSNDENQLQSWIGMFAGKQVHVLRPELQEGRDCCLVSEHQHKLITKWYGASPQIPRKVVRARCGVIIELWPLQLWVEIQGKASSRMALHISRTTPISEVWNAAFQLVNPASSAELRIVVPGPGTPGGDLVDKMSYEALENLCDENFAVLSFREEAPCAPRGARWIESSCRPDAYASSPCSPCNCDSNVNGPNSFPCSPPVSAHASPMEGDSEMLGLDGDNSGSGAKWDKSAAIMHGRGLQGLSNLGNTCFMNSSLQCLSNSEALTRFFLTDSWQKDLNRDNPLGMQGNLAEEFSKVLTELWGEPRNFAVCPRDFKRVIGRFAPQFTGYSQHDSQELLAFLLDGLHEDLNRIHSKPVTEIPTGNGTNDREIAQLAWQRHKLRNDSEIQDLFGGQFRSELECPCGNVSVTFDPCTSVSLQLPQQMSDMHMTILVHLLPDVAAQGTPVKVSVRLPRNNSRIKDLKKEIGALLNIRPESLVVTEVDNNVIKEVHRNDDKLWEWRRCIIDNNRAHAYEVRGDWVDMPNGYYSHDILSSSSSSNNNMIGQAGGPSEAAEAGLIHLKVVHRRKKDVDTLRYYRSEEFQCLGIPFIITISATSCSYEQLRQILTKHVRMLLKEEACNLNNKRQSADTNEDLLCNGFTISSHSRYNYSKFSDAGDAVHDDETVSQLENQGVISLDWSEHAISHLSFEDGGEEAQCHPSCYDRGDGELTLERCLEHFTGTEVLSEQDMWYCGNCKKHVRAKKTMALWSVPRLLVVHLKRFSEEESYGGREKIDTLVNFPLEGLDMKPYLRGGGIAGAASQEERNQDPIYDLYAVSNHYGGSGFGHYTAYGLSPASREWYLFDDSSVSKVPKDQICSSAAYVLFYKLRGYHAGH